MSEHTPHGGSPLEALINALGDTVIGARLDAVRKAYAAADAAVAAFARSSGLTCPEGCGACCQGFVPDVLPAEADYFAAALSVANPDSASILAGHGPLPDSDTCPLFRPDDPFHCGNYEGRPLVCRCFGFAATRDKTGAVAFRLCRHMPSCHAPEVTPPVMADLAAALITLAPHEAGLRARLSDVLPLALRRVLFSAGLALANRDAIS